MDSGAKSILYYYYYHILLLQNTNVVNINSDTHACTQTQVHTHAHTRTHTHSLTLTANDNRVLAKPFQYACVLTIITLNFHTQMFTITRCKHEFVELVCDLARKIVANSYAATSTVCLSGRTLIKFLGFFSVSPNGTTGGFTGPTIAPESGRCCCYRKCVFVELLSTY